MRVLVVDDDPQIRELFTCFLRSAHEITTASSATKALDILGTPESGDFGAVLTDYNMPGMNGVEFAEKGRRFLEKRKRPVPRFILITGNANVPDPVRYVDKVLRKPIIREALITAIEEFT